MDEILKKKKYNVSLAASRLRSPEKPLLLLYSLWLEEETVPSSNRSSTHDTSFLAFSSAQTHPSSSSEAAVYQRLDRSRIVTRSTLT